jgi:hypothetical protein
LCMEPLVSIALVFAMALLWVTVTVLLLSRVNREERRALRQERKAWRMKARQSPGSHVPKRSVQARKRGLRVARRHSNPKPPARPAAG